MYRAVTCVVLYIVDGVTCTRARYFYCFSYSLRCCIETQKSGWWCVESAAVAAPSRRAVAAAAAALLRALQPTRLWAIKLYGLSQHRPGRTPALSRHTHAGKIHIKAPCALKYFFFQHKSLCQYIYTDS